MATKLETLITKLPEELQEYAERYARMLTGQSEEYKLAIIKAIMGQDWQTAYEAMTKTMSNQDLSDEYRRVNEMLKAIALQGDETCESVQQAMVEAALRVLWGLAAAAIG